jgi:hypothetical protein
MANRGLPAPESDRKNPRRTPFDRFSRHLYTCLFPPSDQLLAGAAARPQRVRRRGGKLVIAMGETTGRGPVSSEGRVASMATASRLIATRLDDLGGAIRGDQPLPSGSRMFRLQADGLQVGSPIDL